MRFSVLIGRRFQPIKSSITFIEPMKTQFYALSVHNPDQRISFDLNEMSHNL